MIIYSFVLHLAQGIVPSAQRRGWCSSRARAVGARARYRPVVSMPSADGIKLLTTATTPVTWDHDRGKMTPRPRQHLTTRRQTSSCGWPQGRSEPNTSTSPPSTRSPARFVPCFERELHSVPGDHLGIGVKFPDFGNPDRHFGRSRRQ
jgi:hypothetical protein